ncbi:MAG: ATP-dependent helicase/nuclease subunit A [Enterobacterales bacterium]|jgi:ATP-dependent helicase/nuclease subunit A
MSTSLDQLARKEALDCKQSFIIQAPAGSGKTELLTQRFLALLAEVDQPEEILAITFTRKAASEMRERIIKALKLAQTITTQPEKEPLTTTWKLSVKVLRQNFLKKWQLLENPQRLQVQTIDGFCASLTRRLPYLSGLGCEANTTERSAALYQDAAHQTLALINSDNKAWSASISTLLMHLDGNQARAESLIAEMLSKRDQWLRHLEHDRINFASFRLDLEHSLEIIVSNEIDNKAGQFTALEITELQALSQYAYENIITEALKTGSKPDFFNGFDGHLDESLNLETYPQWQAISRWLLTADGKGLRKTVTKNNGFPAPGTGEDKAQKEHFKTMKLRAGELLKNLQSKQDLFKELNQLPPLKYDDSQWQLLESLMQCLTLATGLLGIIFAQKGEMDFQEVSLRALQALGNEDHPTDLTLALDYQLKHILVDEFQDTSHGQFQLLKKLLYGWEEDGQRTLFLVGDPMQSIYRFREADVGLFLQVRNDGIANVYPKALYLTTNFRSTKNIVDWVNQHFTDILPKNEDITLGAVIYAESIAADTSNSGGIEVYAHFNDKGEAEAAALALLAAKHAQENPDKSLAVLVRSRAQLALLIPAFQQAGLKFKATEIELLGQRPIITDLQMLLRALTDPADRVAWFALLRGPWCGLSLTDLLCVAGSKNSSVMLNCQDPKAIKQLSIDGAKRLSSVLERLLPWLNINNRNTIRQAVEGCWLSIDGPAYIETDVDLQAAELYFDLLSEITQGGAIKDPTELEQQLSKLYAPVASDANANLQIMTIHKSKGLQFDTVILPNLNKGSPNDDSTLLRWMEVSADDEARLLMAPIHAHTNERDHVYDYLSNLAKKQLQFEAGRQLYVACTRAERRLILTATIQTKDDLEADQLSAKKGSQLNELWPATAAIFKQQFSKVLASSKIEEIKDESITKDYRLRRAKTTDHYLADTIFTEDEEYEVPASPSQEQPVVYAASAMKRHVGTVTHNWLEQIADNLKVWDIKRLNAQKSMIKNQLQQLGVAVVDIPKAVELVLLNLQQTLADKQGRYILEQHQDSVSELAIERREEDGFKNYIIDRSFIDEKGVRWIVDYKTSSHLGSGRDDFLMDQKQQYLEQLENYASLFNQLEERPIKLVLYFTQYQKLISWDWKP